MIPSARAIQGDEGNTFDTGFSGLDSNTIAGDNCWFDGKNGSTVMLVSRSYWVGPPAALRSRKPATPVTPRVSIIE